MGVIHVDRRVVKEGQCESGRRVELVDADIRALAVAEQIGPTAANTLKDMHRLGIGLLHLLIKGGTRGWIAGRRECLRGRLAARRHQRRGGGRVAGIPWLTTDG